MEDGDRSARAARDNKQGDEKAPNAHAGVNRPIVEFPDVLPGNWGDPDDFHDAFDLQLRRHGDTTYHLYKVMTVFDRRFACKTFRTWQEGTSQPNSVRSFEMLARVERRYRLDEGYFRRKLVPVDRAPLGHVVPGATVAERKQLPWHLPSDFSQRSSLEQSEILNWFRTVIMSGATDYRRYHKKVTEHRYGLKLELSDLLSDQSGCLDELDRRSTNGGVEPTPEFKREVADLVRFKTATLASTDHRRGLWSGATAGLKLGWISLMFGALAAPPASPAAGYGVPAEDLTVALLAFPSVWNWYLQWRQARRGFYTSWEYDMLVFGVTLNRKQTGWLRQARAMASRLRPVNGLLTEDEIGTAISDWDAQCDRAHDQCLQWQKDVLRVRRVHNDRLEPILPVLESDSPVGAYRRIADEIVKRMPDAQRYPKAAAEAIRSILMVRLGLHLGVRQKNLRQLLFCRRGDVPRKHSELEGLRRGELRWNKRAGSWEVFIPNNAFKNCDSSFFGRKPFHLLLPDLANLYQFIEEYLDRHRSTLLSVAEDPGTFFVKSAKYKSTNAAYDNKTFYIAWRLMIQRYGIYNPYTKRGAIEGLLPHGPHCLRSVLATHILKSTGSYAHASYAIQTTPQTVAVHYGRFLPCDKAAIAAAILNKVWEAD